MAFSGETGARIELSRIPFADERRQDAVLLFSESNSRFLVEVEVSKRDKFERAFAGIIFSQIGETTNSDTLEIAGLSGKTVVFERLSDLKESWQAPLRW
jgi:phosphoribosylformylglycinamidine synthase